MMAQQGRALGSFESAAALTHDASPFLAVAVVRLDRGPADETLRQALDAMQARTPLLRARIVKDASRTRFELEGTPRIPLEVRARGGEDAWHAAAEEALNHRLDAATGPLLRVMYLRAAPAGTPAEIVLAFHHTIVDAVSGQHFVGELLRFCADPDSIGPSAGDAVPPPTDALVPQSYRGLPGGLRRAGYVAREAAGELRYRLRARRRAPSPPIPATATCRILPRELEPDGTAALIDEAHRRRVTLNSALSAALGVAVWRCRYGERPMTVQALAFADLRPYLRPPVPPETLACHIAMLRYPMAMRPGLGFWDVAQSFQERLYRSSRRGEKFLANRMTRQVMQMALRSRTFRMAHTALSYAGSLRLAAAYGTMRVRGLHAFVADIPTGPEFSALARLDRDRIQWDFLYLAEDMDRSAAEGLAAEVLDVLERASGRGLRTATR